MSMIPAGVAAAPGSLGAVMGAPLRELERDGHAVARRAAAAVADLDAPRPDRNVAGHAVAQVGLGALDSVLALHARQLT